jgi:hypothetical protein
MIEKKTLEDNLKRIQKQVSDAAESSGRSQEDVKLIPVSKTFAPEVLKLATDLGVNLFGESYAQELKTKYEWFEEKGFSQPEWHFIGHLQRNKVKYIAPYVHTIHAVDTLKLANQINKEAEKNERKINILIQINTSGEESKYGFNEKDFLENLNTIDSLSYINLVGLMTIAGLDATIEENVVEFKRLKELKNKASELVGRDLKELSMGMSSDFKEAIVEGSTLVRIGSAIFGKRDYKK